MNNMTSLDTCGLSHQGESLPCIRYLISGSTTIPDLACICKGSADANGKTLPKAVQKAIARRLYAHILEAMMTDMKMTMIQTPPGLPPPTGTPRVGADASLLANASLPNAQNSTRIPYTTIRAAEETKE